MSWMNSIIWWLKDIEDYFYDAYLEVYSWRDPLWYLAYPLLYVSRGFGWLAYYFSLFNNWLYDANIKLKEILNWSTIWNLITSYIPNWDKIGTWFSSWTNTVVDLVTGWGSVIRTTIEGWINTATQGFNSLKTAWDYFWRVTFPQWISELDSLKASWNNFWQIEFPKLLKSADLETWWNSRLLDVGHLISDTLRDWFPFYDTLADFFSNPLNWLERRFTNWFLGEE